ncbi:MAG: hypothetical protein RL112_650 [Planctomycetota bacterium]|jgi:diguanylate cyclase (GGDEF)-like protein
MESPSDNEPRLYTLAQIQHVLKVEFARARRYRYPLSLVHASIDGLAALRERQGFEGKEAAFQAVAALLHGLTRASDCAGRLPDDSFLVVVPHTDAAGAARLVERMLEGARGLRLAGALGAERLTLSLGRTTLAGEEVPYQDQLRGAAERALRRAQAEGGDRGRDEPPLPS